MIFYPEDVPTIMRALFLAAEWEDSVLDSYSGVTDPVLLKGIDTVAKSKADFLALHARLKAEYVKETRARLKEGDKVRLRQG